MNMNLEELRTEIRETDAMIAELVARRTNIAELVGAEKLRQGLAIKNASVEEKVVARYRDAGEARGINPDTMETIARALIKEAVDREASLPDPKRVRLNIAIVGGSGKMGHWFEMYLSSMGHVVKIIDPAKENGLVLEDAANADAVIVSVPIGSTGGILEKLDGICGKDALIFDVASLKTSHTETLKKMASRRKVCSVHPMFGPSARSLYGQNVLICNCGNGKAVEEAVELFRDKGGNIRIMALDEHDKYMSYVLGLSHAVNIAFFTVLERSGIPYKDMESAASTTYTKIMSTNKSVAMEDPELYYDIQHLNGHRDEMWELFSKAVDDIKEASVSDERTGFVRIMNAGKRYFSL